MFLLHERSVLAIQINVSDVTLFADRLLRDASLSGHRKSGTFIEKLLYKLYKLMHAFIDRPTYASLACHIKFTQT